MTRYHNCAECAAPFVPVPKSPTRPHLVARFCSAECRAEKNRRRCPNSAKQRRRESRAKPALPATCKACGCEFPAIGRLTAQGRLGPRPKYCSEGCRARRRQDKMRGYAKRFRLEAKYNLSVAEHDDLLVAQGGGCAICGASVSPGGRALSVDHDHKTGRVRGILCAPCNQAIGLMRDDPRRLLSGAAYLRGSIAPHAVC